MAVLVEVLEVRAAGGGWPWPTLLATVVEDGRRVIVAAEGPGVDEIAADLADGCVPRVTVEGWQLVGVA